MKRNISSYTICTKTLSSIWDNYHIKENRKYKNKSSKSYCNLKSITYINIDKNVIQKHVDITMTF